MEFQSPRVSVFKPGEEGLEQTLGALESQVMDALWSTDDPMCVDDVRRILQESGKDSAYTTIMTTLARLYRKGFLAREMKGRAYYYAPRISRRELGSSVTKQVIDGLLGAFAEPTMSYFVDALSDSDPDKLDALAEMIREKRKKAGKGG
jgi:predicted transcriptional regulator